MTDLIFPRLDVPNAYRDTAALPSLTPDSAFVALAISIIDGGGRLDSERIEDMRSLIDTYLTDTEREDLGWARRNSEGER